MAERHAFVLPTRQRLRANLVTRQTLSAALSVARVILAVLRSLAFCFAKQLFGALELLGDGSTSTRLFD